MLARYELPSGKTIEIPDNKRISDEHLAFLRELHEIGLPEDITKEFFAICKRVLLSNFTERDIKYMRRLYYDTKLSWLMKIATYEYTFEMANKFTQLDIIFNSILSSAREGFERKQVSTSTQVHQVSYLGERPIQRGGFFGRILRRR